MRRRVRAPRAPLPTVTIDFDGLQHRILAVPGVADATVHESQRRRGGHGLLHRAVAAAAAAAAARAAARRCIATRCATSATTPFVTGVADYDVSVDGHKLLYRGGGGGGGGRGGRGGAQPAAVRRSSSSTPIASRRRPAQGASNADLRAYIDPKQEFKQIFDEAWRNQRDYLYVPNKHGADWPKMKEMYGALLPYVNHRADLNYLIDKMGAEIAIGHSYVRGGDMPDVPAAVPGGLLGADFVDRERALQASRRSTTTRAGTPICARRSRRRASTCASATTSSRSTGRS